MLGSLQSYIIRKSLFFLWVDKKNNFCTPQFSSLSTYCSLPSTTLNTDFVEREEYDFHYLKLSEKSFEGTFGELDTCSLDFVKQKGCVSFLPEETQWWIITARVAGLMAERRETGAVGRNYTSAHSRTRVSEFRCGSSWTDKRDPTWSHVHSYLRALPKRKMWHTSGLPESRCWGWDHSGYRAAAPPTPRELQSEVFSGHTSKTSL